MANPASPKQITFATNLAAEIEAIQSGASKSEILNRDSEYDDGTWSTKSISDEIDFLLKKLKTVQKENGIKARPANAASDKQVSFYSELYDENVELWTQVSETPEKIRQHLTDVKPRVIEQFSNKTKRDASNDIDFMMQANRALKVQIAEKRAADPQAKAEDEALMGFHRVGDEQTVLRLVKKTQKGFVVGYDVYLRPEGREIVYLGKKGLKGLSEQTKMTADERGALIKLLGFSYCLDCGRELTDPESIERGIGPICASK